jgi:hypothetical protein
MLRVKYKAEVNNHTETTTLLGIENMAKCALQVQKDHMKKLHDARVADLQDRIQEIKRPVNNRDRDYERRKR